MLSISNQARTPEVYKDFSKRAHTVQMHVKRLLFPTDLKLPGALCLIFEANSPVRTRITFGFQLNSRAQLLSKSGAACPTALPR